MNDHLLHEAAYRGDKIIESRANKRILVLGAGALGSWISTLLTRQGYSSLTILDFDRVEKKNFGTQNYGKVDIGRMKSVVTANHIIANFGNKCISITDKLDSLNAVKILTPKNYDLAIDAFDNHESRNLVQQTCSKSKLDCIHCGMSADGFAEVEWNEKYKAHPNPKAVRNGEPCEYPLALNLVFFTSTLAVEAVNAFFEQKMKRTIHFTLKDLHCDMWTKV